MNTRNDWNHQQDDVGNHGDSDATRAMPDSSWPDPWDDPHDIEYWVWDGEQLAPATSGERASIQEMERTQSARRRLALWEREQRVATWKQFAARVAGFVGIQRIIAAARTIRRHGAQSVTSPLEAHHTAMSAHQQDGER